MAVEKGVGMGMGKGMVVISHFPSLFSLYCLTVNTHLPNFLFSFLFLNQSPFSRTNPLFIFHDISHFFKSRIHSFLFRNGSELIN